MQNYSLAITAIILILLAGCQAVEQPQISNQPTTPEQIENQTNTETTTNNESNSSPQTIYHSEPGENLTKSWRDGEGIVIFASDGEKGATTFIPEGETLNLPLAGETSIEVVGVEEEKALIIVNGEQRFVDMDKTERFGPLLLQITDIFYLG